MDHEISKNGIESHHIYLPRMKELAGSDPGRKAFVRMLKKLGREDEFMTIIDKYEYEQILHEAEKKDSKDEGVKEGIEQGIQEGIEIKQKEIVNKLIELGYPKDEIKKITELSDEEIDKYITQDE